MMLFAGFVVAATGAVTVWGICARLARHREFMREWRRQDEWYR